MDVPADKRKDIGLQTVFNSVFPIKDFTGSASLEFVDYRFAENDPRAAKPDPPRPLPLTSRSPFQTLRVDVNKIDKVMDLTGEVVLVRNRLLNIVNRLEHQYSDDHDVQSLLEAVSFLDLITSDMQLGVMKMRMQPIAKVFSKFPRLVRDISGPLGKGRRAQGLRRGHGGGQVGDRADRRSHGAYHPERR